MSGATQAASAQFPLLHAAMVAFEAAFKVSQALPSPPLSSRRQAQDREVEARANVVRAYASELLPAILGGSWKKTDSTVWIPSRGLIGRPVYSDYHELFDHPVQFRRRGAKGASTWESWVILGRPYNTFDKHGSVNPRHRDLAGHLSTRQDVGVWARRDLSAWFPGSTSLVVAARGLRAEDAPKFGFEALAEAPGGLLVSERAWRRALHMAEVTHPEGGRA